MNKFDDLGLGVPRGGGGAKPTPWVHSRVFGVDELLNCESNRELTNSNGVTPLTLPAQIVKGEGLNYTVTGYADMFFHLKHECELRHVKYEIDYVSGNTGFTIKYRGNGKNHDPYMDEVVYDKVLTSEECSNGFDANVILRAGWYSISGNKNYKYSTNATKSYGNNSFCDTFVYYNGGSISDYSYGIGEFNFHPLEVTDSYLIVPFDVLSDFVNYDKVVIEGTGNPTIQIINPAGEVVKTVGFGEWDISDLPFDRYVLKVLFHNNGSFATVSEVEILTNCETFIGDKTYTTKLVAGTDVERYMVCAINSDGEAIKLPVTNSLTPNYLSASLQRTYDDTEQASFDRFHAEYLGNSRYLFYSCEPNQRITLLLTKVKGVSSRTLSKLVIPTDYIGEFNGIVRLDSENILVCYGSVICKVAKISVTNDKLALVWEAQLPTDGTTRYYSQRMAMNEDTKDVFIYSYISSSSKERCYYLDFNADGTISEFRLILETTPEYYVKGFYWLKDNHFVVLRVESKSDYQDYYAKLVHYEITPTEVIQRGILSNYCNNCKKYDVVKHKNSLIFMYVSTSKYPSVRVYSLNQSNLLVSKYHNGYACSATGNKHNNTKKFGIMYLGDNKFLWACPEYKVDNRVSIFPNNPVTQQMGCIDEVRSPFAEFVYPMTEDPQDVIMEYFIVNSEDNGCLLISLNKPNTLEHGVDKGTTNKILGDIYNGLFGIVKENKNKGDLVEVQLDGNYLVEDGSFDIGGAVFFNGFGHLTQDAKDNIGLVGVANSSNTLDMIDSFDNLPSRMYSHTHQKFEVQAQNVLIIDVIGCGRFTYKGISKDINRPRHIFVDGREFAIDLADSVFENIYFNKSLRIFAGYKSGSGSKYAKFELILEVIN